MLLKGAAYATLHARICADCGGAELYVAPVEAARLYEAYQKSQGAS